MFYISPRDQGIYSYPEEGINYGISHFQENGREPVAGFRIVEHPVRKSAFTGKKPRFMDEANTSRSPRENYTFNTADYDRKCLFQELFEHLKEKNCAKRAGLLIDYLGFRDSGIDVGGDMLLIYDFFHRPCKFEIYLDKDSGSVTEINLFNFNNSKEYKYPVTSQGFTMMYTGVLEDLFECYLPKGIDVSESASRAGTGLAEITAKWPFTDGMPEDTAGIVSAYGTDTGSHSTGARDADFAGAPGRTAENDGRKTAGYFDFRNIDKPVDGVKNPRGVLDIMEKVVILLIIIAVMFLFFTKF